MITPELPGSKNLLMGVICVDPGKSPHRWHTHIVDKGEEIEIVYPQDFEEAYYITKGKGVVTWKIGGKQEKLPIEEGDAVYFPIEVAEHQVFNTGNEQMVVVFVATPPTHWRNLR
jgi:mannose-6-phosphate isomerase-like protein (cupin superfamily)